MQQNSPLARILLTKRTAIIGVAIFSLLLIGNHLSSRNGEKKVVDAYYTSGEFIKHHMESIPQFEIQSALFFYMISASRTYVPHKCARLASERSSSHKSKPRLYRRGPLSRQPLASTRTPAFALVSTPECQNATMAHPAHVF